MEKNSKEIEEGKIFAVVAYWGFLCILPLILKKDNKFCVYHGKQGLVLFIFLVGAFLFNVIPGVGQFVWHWASYIYLLALLWGSLQSLLGNYCRIPIVTDLAEKIVL
ncbi:MAG: hypothetical protein WC532_02860 [Candidatus Omnitrophota bacterium]